MNKTWKTFLLITGTVCVLLVVFSVVFYLVFLPIIQENKRAELQDAKDKEQSDQAVALSICLDSADVGYNEYLKSQDVIPNDGNLITTLPGVLDRAKKDKQDAIDICFKKYPAK